MLSETGRTIILDYLKRKHSTSQIINICKYILGKRKTIISWDPIYLTIFTTYKCNLHCDMCLTHSKKHDNLYGQKPCKDMSYETFKQALNMYNKALMVTLTGNGEPLLNKDFFRMAEYASKVMGMYVFSATNGTLIGQYKEQLVNSYLDWLSVSINGHSPEEYVRITGMSKETYKLICQNTKELVKLRNINNAKLKIWASFILDNNNYIYLKEIINFAQTIGIDGILFLHFLPKEGFDAEARCLFSDDINVLKEFNNIKRIKSNMKVILPRLLDRKMLKHTNEFKYCKVPFYNLTIDGEGNVGGCGCQLLDNSKNGKYHDKDAWSNPYFQQFRNRFIDPNLPILEPCTWCHNNLPSTEKSLLGYFKKFINIV